MKTKSRNVKVEFLSEYVSLGCEFSELLEAYEHFKEKLLTTPSASVSNMPKGNGSCFDKIPKDICRLEELEELIARRSVALSTKRLLIEKIIADLPRSSQRRVMTMRYLEGMKWEKIAVKMHYSWAHVHTIHSESLRIINLTEM